MSGANHVSLTPDPLAPHPLALVSPVAHLDVHAAERSDQPALLGTTEGSTASLTWSELGRRALDGGAGMTTAGVRPGDVVLVLMAAGVRAVEVELAVRCVGAVPLLLPDHMDPADAATLLTGLPVRLVVVDAPQRLAVLRLAGLEVEILECDDERWGRLRAVGANRLLEHPHLITLAAQAVTPASTASVVGVTRDKSAPWLVRPEANGATDELGPDDVVLLVGAPSDRLATVVRRAHHASGCTLAWLGSVEDLPAALAAVRPTHLFLDQESSRALEHVLCEARVDGELWHPTPAAVLDAAAAQAGEARLRGKTRKLAASVRTLAPWFGGRLRQLVLDTRVDRTLLGLAAGLDLRIGRVAHNPARQAALGAATQAPAPVARQVVGQPDASTSRTAPPARSSHVHQSLAQRAADRLRAAQSAAPQEAAAARTVIRPAAGTTPAPASTADQGLPTRSRGGRDSAFSIAAGEE